MSQLTRVCLPALLLTALSALLIKALVAIAPTGFIWILQKIHAKSVEMAVVIVLVLT